MKIETHDDADKAPLSHGAYASTDAGTAAMEKDSAIGEVTRVGMRRYRASLAAVTPQSKRNTVIGDERRCVLAISLGSANSEGAKFAACIRWIADHFDECALLVADGIYHHTLQVVGDISLGESRARALQAGRDFMTQYERVVAPHRKRCHFEWQLNSRMMEGQRFRRYLADFQHLYQQNEVYGALVDEFSDQYLHTVLGRRGPISDDQLAIKRQCGREYLVEECAIYTVMSEEGWRVFLYPGAIKTFEQIAEGRVPEAPAALRQLTIAALRLNRGAMYFADSDAAPFAAPVYDGPSSGNGTGNGNGDVNARVNARVNSDAVGQDILADFGDRDWQCLLSYTTRRRYLAGDMLVCDGNDQRILYILLRGNLEVLLGDWRQNHRLRQVAILGPTSLVGVPTFVHGHPQTGTVAALGDCEVLVLHPKQFARMQNKDPALAAALQSDIGRLLQGPHGDGARHGTRHGAALSPS